MIYMVIIKGYHQRPPTQYPPYLGTTVPELPLLESHSFEFLFLESSYKYINNYI